LGCADSFGSSKVSLYVLNVNYPLVPEEWVRFCRGKRAVLVAEEGQPEFIEQGATQILHRHEVNTRLLGKGALPMQGEYTVDVLRAGFEKFISEWAPSLRTVRSIGKADSAVARMSEKPLIPAARLAA